MLIAMYYEVWLCHFYKLAFFYNSADAFNLKLAFLHYTENGRHYILSIKKIQLKRNIQNEACVLLRLYDGYIICYAILSTN